MMPLALTGHSSSGGSHDVATNSLIWHLVGAAFWAGGLFALLAHARRRGAHTDVAARRFSFVATICFVAMAISGVVNALVRVPLDDLFSTTYGRLIVAKIVALVVLGVFGFLQRRRALPALAADPESRARSSGSRAPRPSCSPRRSASPSDSAALRRPRRRRCRRSPRWNSATTSTVRRPSRS